MKKHTILLIAGVLVLGAAMFSLASCEHSEKLSRSRSMSVLDSIDAAQVYFKPLTK